MEILESDYKSQTNQQTNYKVIKKSHILVAHESPYARHPVVFVNSRLDQFRDFNNSGMVPRDHVDYVHHILHIKGPQSSP